MEFQETPFDELKKNYVIEFQKHLQNQAKSPQLYQDYKRHTENAIKLIKNLKEFDTFETQEKFLDPQYLPYLQSIMVDIDNKSHEKHKALLQMQHSYFQGMKAQMPMQQLNQMSYQQYREINQQLQANSAVFRAEGDAASGLAVQIPYSEMNHVQQQQMQQNNLNGQMSVMQVDCEMQSELSQQSCNLQIDNEFEGGQNPNQQKASNRNQNFNEEDEELCEVPNNVAQRQIEEAKQHQLKNMSCEKVKDSHVSMLNKLDPNSIIINLDGEGDPKHENNNEFSHVSTTRSTINQIFIYPEIMTPQDLNKRYQPQCIIADYMTFAQLDQVLHKMISEPYKYTQNIEDQDFKNTLLIGFSDLKMKSRYSLEIENQITSSQENVVDLSKMQNDARFATPDKRDTYLTSLYLTPRFLQRFDFEEQTNQQVKWKVKHLGSQLGFIPTLQLEQVRKGGYRQIRFQCEYKKHKYQVAKEDDDLDSKVYNLNHEMNDKSLLPLASNAPSEMNLNQADQQNIVPSEQSQNQVSQNVPSSNTTVANNMNGIESMNDEIQEGDCPFKIVYKCRVDNNAKDSGKYALVSYDPYHNHPMGPPQ